MSTTQDSNCPAGTYTLLGEAATMLVQLKTHGPLWLHVGASAPADSAFSGVYLGVGEDDVSLISLENLEAGDKVYGKPVGNAAQTVGVIATGVVAMPAATGPG
jgi:hypothetical protein